ncbi:MAG: AAA family ATPase [Fimbriimonadaceae bacterium]
MPKPNQRFIFTGGPGTGKTTTLIELQSRGYVCMPDVARRIIQERIATGLSPRPEPIQFAQEMLRGNIEQYNLHPDPRTPIFFDYGIIESLMMLQECDPDRNVAQSEMLQTKPYNRTAFFFPPWEAIYTQDSERDHTFSHAVEVAVSIRRGYESLGFTLVDVPAGRPSERAEFVLRWLTLLKEG